MPFLALAALLGLVSTNPVFETGGILDEWDVLDYRGDVRVEQTTVTDCPPGYGPEVVRVSGTLALLLAKGGHMSDGTYAALYRERAPATQDADGVILFGGAFGDDLSLEHNTKTMRPHLWLEQDNDTGISFRYQPAEGEDHSIKESVAVGLVTDPWNVTGWIWQKVQVSGTTVRAKYWPAHEGEPDAWQVETESEVPGDRFGIRINSGEIDLAWFAADVEDIAVPVPANFLFLPRRSVAAGETLPIVIYTNRDAARDELFNYTLRGRKDAPLISGSLIAPLPEGTGATPFRLGSQEDWIAPELSAPLAEGHYTLSLTPASGGPSVEREFRVEAESDIVGTLRARETLLDQLDILPEKDGTLREVLLVARGLLQQAQSHQDAGDGDGAADTLHFVDETLAELHGVAGDGLRESGAAIDWASLPNGYDGETGVGNPKNGMQDHYRTASRIRFGKARGSLSAVMGHDLRIDIPFEVIGDSPETDYTIHIALKDRLGIRTVAEAAITPNPPTSQWVPGKAYLQRVSLPIPRDDTQKGVSQPVVLDEMHDVLVSVRDETTGAYVLLDNPPGEHPNRVGQGYVAKQIYVSSAPVEILSGGIMNFDTGDELCIDITNYGPALGVRVLFRVLAPSGVPIAEYVQDAELGAVDDRFGKTTVRIQTGKKFRGGALADVSIYGDTGLLTRMTAPMMGDVPEGSQPTFTRANHVESRDMGLTTPITITPPKILENPLSVTVAVRGKVVAEYEDIRESTILYPPPHFGYYDITATSGDTSWHERMVATVIEIGEGQLLVNGEPFIVKGVNVHGMDSHSPARTRLMMDLLKDLGFNSLRGDYPPRWQIDMAHEAGLTYDVLAPFSVSSTAEIFARQDGPSLSTARAVTRQFIERYADAAAVLLWNSANEIREENIPFLLAQHPLYKLYDPYQRPVHYANLYGQDLWQGQDVMGVNYYFSDTQKAVDRQPLIERSAAIAQAHGLPMIFTEYNSYHGAVPTTGVEAMEDLFTWGVETAGMAGGYFYMLPNSDRHPGVFDVGYNTHRIMNDAFHRAFDDARVRVADWSGAKLKLEIENIRPFALRRGRLELSAMGQEMATVNMPDIPAEETTVVEVSMPEQHPGHARTVSGTLHFETHHGLQNRVPVQLVAGG